MSPTRPWLSFERQGGAPPRDDEALALAQDGSFTAHRTIGGRAIGSFEGRLSRTALGRVQKGVAALDEAHDLEIPTPREGATEVLSAGGRTIRLGSNESAPKPWAALVKAIREVFEREVVDHPRAAIHLVADARAAHLEHAGDAAIDVDLGSVEVRAVLRADDGAIRGRWSGRPPDALVDNGETVVASHAWVTTEPGWVAALPFDHALALGPGDYLQVWVDVAVREDGRRRAGQLYQPVLTDG
jgi:hypothetical protein